MWRTEIFKLVVVAVAVSFILVMSTAIVSILYGRFIEEESDTLQPPDFSSLSNIPEIVVDVYFHQEQEIVTKNLEEYLIGVIIAEMPPKFDFEALKAQAVAARTYTASRMQSLGGHGCSLRAEADICTNPNNCQAHYTKEQVEELYSENAQEYYNRVSEAVKTTAGEVITYNGELVPEAPYHSTCGGKTETAGAVWSADHSYLKSVDCEYCQHSDYYNRKMSISMEQLKRKLEKADLTVPVLAEDEVPELTVINSSKNGRIQTVELAENKLSGHEMREIFDIPSTNLEWQVTDDEINVITKGFGHGVGLCQYGADGKGKQEYDYREIIKYYFQDVDIELLTVN